MWWPGSHSGGVPTTSSASTSTTARTGPSGTGTRTSTATRACGAAGAASPPAAWSRCGGRRERPPSGPAPAGTARGPRPDATTIAFRLAGGHPGGPGGPRAVAAGLAARLRGLSWVEAATVAGEGYLVVTVTADALACLAVRITEAGPACDHSSALAG